MGPVLKTLLGLYLFIWTVLGILFIAGGFMMAAKFPDFKASFATATDAIGGKNGTPEYGQNQTGDSNQKPDNVSPEMQACVEKALGKEAIEELKSQNSQPTPEQQQALQKCGFQPDMQQESGQKVQPGGPGGQVTNPPPNGTPGTFSPTN